MEVYIKALKVFMKGSKLLAGEKYPSACAVIPVLGQV